MQCLSPRILVIACAGIGLMCPCANAQKLKINQVVWGFDGRVTPNEFNPVSILLDNQSDEPFEGSIALQQRSGTGQAIGAPFVEEGLYIQALGRRWLQFVPYMGTAPDGSNWQLRWKGGRERLPTVNAGKAAMVRLSKSGGLGAEGKGVRNFDEAIFPTSVTATSGLRSLVMDHMPRWEKPRRQALSDWLRLGGQLHILHADDGEYPKFNEELSILNGPLDRQKVGSGTIFRHARQASKLDSQFAKQARAMEQAVRRISTDDGEDALEREIERLKAKTMEGFPTLQYGWDAAERAHGSLMEITQPDHNWALIYLLSIIYILIIFPGCFLLGRRRAHYLVTYGAILGAAGVFSLAFLFVGRRGYGERTEVNAVAIAQRIEGDRWEIMQWSNAFVTRGDTYDLTHAGEGTAYATGQETEPVRGSIAKRERDNQQVARTFRVEIPPFSNRPYVHRQTVAIPQFSAKVLTAATGQELTEVTIQVDDRLRNSLAKIPYTPRASNQHRGFVEDTPGQLPIVRAVYQNTVYSLNVDWTTGMLTLGGRLGAIHQFIDARSLNQYANTMGFWYDKEKPPPEQRYARLFHAMVAHHFGIFSVADLAETGLAPDHIRLLVYTKMPEEMFIQGDTFSNQKGYVLFSQDLTIETTP